MKAGAVKRQRLKNILRDVLWHILFFSLISGAPAWADSGVKLVGPDAVWPASVRVDLASLKPYEETLSTIDPNFKNEGVAEFRGIRLSKLLETARISPDQGLTVIGADQYVGYLPGDKLTKGFLAWEMNQKPIQGLKGGPLKILFPEDAGIHTSCYTWYVDAMVAGSAARAELTVVSGGSRTRYSRAELLAHAGPLAPSRFSIAQGCRNTSTQIIPAKS